jgi:O-antigen/teichoic acid export membrane protein
LVSIVRTKFVAVLLGTTGVGILGLFNAPLGLIASITGLGISYSAIRDISEANGSGDEQRLARTITTFRRWVLFTGFLGMLVTILLSPWLSKWTFGNSNYIGVFIWLSVTLLLNDICAGQKALLQGMRKLQSMAKATVIGSVMGLFASIPLYYIYGVKGIVPALIVSAIVALLLSWYFAKKVPVATVMITYKASFYEGMTMIKLGIILSISAQIGALVSYLLNSFISRTGGIEQVGLYSAGMGLTGTSVGLVFTAMGMDYYPKLAAMSKDNKAVRSMVNQQSIMSVLIILPIVLCLLTTMPIIIRLFLSKAFIEVTPFVNLTVLGVMVKAVSYPIGYISFAKGDSKVFFWLEGIISNILNLMLSLFFYKVWGLIGIGVAFIVLYTLYLLIVYNVAKKRYEFSFEKELYIVLSVSIFLSILAYLSLTFLSSYLLYFVLLMLIIIASAYSFIELNKRINIKPVLMSYLNKFRLKK